MTINLYLLVKPNTATDAIEFYKKLFNAREKYILRHGNKTYYSELLIGTSTFMIADSDDLQYTLLSNPNLFASIHVDNVDKFIENAINMKCLLEIPAQDQWWGDRTATILDLYGIRWYVITSIHKLSHQEITNRFNKLVKFDSDIADAKFYRIKYDKYKNKLNKLFRG